jgi:hypothetical protein
MAIFKCVGYFYFHLSLVAMADAVYIYSMSWNPWHVEAAVDACCGEDGRNMATANSQDILIATRLTVSLLSPSKFSSVVSCSMGVTTEMKRCFYLQRTSESSSFRLDDGKQ